MATKVTIERKGNGWLVRATIVRDLGDGIPWPYEHASVYAFDESPRLLSDVAHILFGGPEERKKGAAMDATKQEGEE